MKPHWMVQHNAFKLRHKNRLLASLSGGYYAIMKNPAKAIERYSRLIDFAILDKNEESLKEKYQILRELPSIEHYKPKILGRDLLVNG